MFPTLLAIAGDADITKKLHEGHTVGSMTYKVHLDGYNIVPYLTGAVKESPRQAIFYFSDDGEVIAVRAGDWKLTFAEQRATTMKIWQEPFVKLRLPNIYNLRRDPFERATYNSNTYLDWMVDHVPQLYMVTALVAAQIEEFVKYPPRQKPASFNLDEVMRAVQSHK
jgi:arylsulfatase